MRVLFPPLLLCALAGGCGYGVLHDAGETHLQLVPSTALPVQRTIGLQLIADREVGDVQLLRDGKLLAPLAPPAYAYVWDAGNEPEGTYRLTAIARTAWGDKPSSNVVEVVIDRTRPEVAGWSPAPGPDAVAMGNGFQVSFSEPLLRSSFSDGSVTAFRDGAVAAVGASLSADGKTITVAPVARLKGTYRLRLSDALSDLAGNPLRVPPDALWEKVAVPPGPVEQLIASAGNDAVRLDWAPPLDDGGMPVTKFVVRQVGNATWSLVVASALLVVPSSGLPSLDLGSTASLKPPRLGMHPWSSRTFQKGVPVAFTIAAVSAAGEGPAALTAEVMPSLAGPIHSEQAAVTLESGQVLIVGSGFAEPAPCPGEPALVLTACPALLYDPATGDLLPAGVGERPRIRSAAARLADGRVLIAGGHSQELYPGTTTAQIYDPSTKSFADTGPMVFPEFGGTALTLNDGRVLLGFFELSDFTGHTPDAQIYEPSTGAFLGLGAVDIDRPGLAALLPSGKVLLTGFPSPDPLVSKDVASFDPGPVGARQFSIVPVGFTLDSRGFGTATVLRDGRVLFAGGLGQVAGASGTAEVYDPLQGTFTRAADLLAPRIGHTATLLDDGRVLLAGGTADGQASVEIYDPVAGGVAAPGLRCPRSWHTANRLPGNKLLLLGGDNEPGPGGCPDEVYTLP